MLPARALSTAQLVPNWKLMTMPDTTPMPNDTAKIFSQKKYTSRHRSSRVRSQRHSMKASQLARPMVNAGKQDVERDDETELDSRQEATHPWATSATRGERRARKCAPDAMMSQKTPPPAAIARSDC